MLCLTVNGSNKHNWLINQIQHKFWVVALQPDLNFQLKKKEEKKEQHPSPLILLKLKKKKKKIVENSELK